VTYSLTGSRCSFFTRSAIMTHQQDPPLTPTTLEAFDAAWVKHVLSEWFLKNDFPVESVNVLKVSASLNSLQGLLSTTYQVEVTFSVKGGAEEQKSIFVKVPLTGSKAQDYKEVNTREFSMLSEVLPKLQTYIVDHCTDILSLPIPEILYCHYSGDEKHDAFVMENLVASGFVPYGGEGDLTEDKLKSCLECLAQLHGTGMAFKLHQGGVDEVLALFPKMSEQAQLQDILEKRETRKCIRRNFLPFLKYLEICDPSLTSYTGFLARIAENLFGIFKELNTSSLEKLLTICHGDAKPDNFMFRKIEIDLEDMECEGLEGILIDWQGGFIGSVSNDLMWLIPPFIEANSDNSGLIKFAMSYYCSQLNLVLTSFGKSLTQAGLPESPEELTKRITRGFIVELLNVVIINPIIQIPAPPSLRNWYRRRMRHEERLKEGITNTCPPAMPRADHVFQSANFKKFANLYLKLGHCLGAFQELNLINFNIVKEKLMRPDEEKSSVMPDSDEHENDIYEDEEVELSDDDPPAPLEGEEWEKNQSIWRRIFSWIVNIFFPCKKKEN